MSGEAENAPLSLLLLLGMFQILPSKSNVCFGIFNVVTPPSLIWASRLLASEAAEWLFQQTAGQVVPQHRLEGKFVTKKKKNKKNLFFF